MKKKKNIEIDFTTKLLGLISEPNFIKFLNIFSEPNIFKIVGRTHYERWHSAFIGWLLDANGSHLLADYVLTRFLFALLEEDTLKSIKHNEFQLFKVLPILDFSKIEVVPNEYTSTELTVGNVGRFDIFLKGSYFDKFTDVSKNINIIFELKIDSQVNSNQSKKYADWIYNNHPNDDNFLIYILPNLLSSSKATVGDDRWYCINYQLLNDKIILPILDHPNLNEKVKPFIIQYTKNLKFRYKGIKMAITTEEKRLAISLYEKYCDVFDAIFDALQEADTIDYSTSDIPKRGKKIGKIVVKIENKVFEGKSINDLFQKVLKYLVDSNKLNNIQMPWGTGNSRYIISNQSVPVHPNGRDFFIPVKYKEYSMETHVDRKRGIKILDDFCKELKLSFETIEI
ncbi:MAG: PD-(D/E)XK nuclease family protein [Ignavibacteria bacterium]|nr:PD-(D/E)XK nuclease family protein [Ignavibacteria bacterium]